MAVFDFGNERAQNLGDAKYEKDAINLRTLKLSINNVNSTFNSFLPISGGTLTGTCVFNSGLTVNNSCIINSELTINNGISVITGGTNSHSGVVGLVSGLATVNTINITDSSMIFLTAQDNNTTGSLRISSRTPLTSFDITSTNLSDSGNVAWMIIEPID